MKYICVFFGSSEDGAIKYAEVTKQIGKDIVSKGYGLVYGGGNVGLMKILADSVKEAGGDVIGVVTPEVIKLGVVYKGITIIEEPTYSARKAKMAALSVGFIALPGGYGTIDEFTEVAIHNQFASYKNTSDNPVKPACLLNIDGFYDGFQQQIRRCLQEKFVTQKHAAMIHFESNPQKAIAYIANFENPRPDDSKWWEKSTTHASQNASSLSKEFKAHASSGITLKTLVANNGFVLTGLMASVGMFSTQVIDVLAESMGYGAPKFTSKKNSGL